MGRKGYSGNVTVHVGHKDHHRTMNKLRRFWYLHERIVGEFQQILISLTGRLSPWPFYSASATRRGGPSGFTPLGGSWHQASSQVNGALR